MELRRLQIGAIAVAAMFVWATSANALVQGIDVSHWQGSINWTSVKNAGIQFAFCKVSDGYGDYDPTYATNLSGAIAAGIPVGPYHFAYPNTGTTNPLDAANEANYFVDLIQPYYQGPGLMLRPVLDLEQLAGVGTTAQEKAFLSQWTRNFVAVVRNRLGVDPIIYANGNYAQNYYASDLSQYPLWFAKPITPTPSDPTDVAYQNNINNVSPPTDAQMGIWSSYAFWQWSSEGAISGISGNVDRNVFNGTMEQLAAYIPGFLPGDYNGDNVVDAKDYTKWRDTMGQSVKIGLGADGNLSGTIDAGDYSVWKSHFGTSGAGSGAASPSAVPEPASVMLLAIALAAASRLRLRIASCR
jgi:GH25 family lysozyme M1 (1,4-beta-N-acetylmuramidase)